MTQKLETNILLNLKGTLRLYHINGSANKSGQCNKTPKSNDDNNKSKYNNEWYFKHYVNKTSITGSNKMRLEVLSNAILQVALGKEKVTKYRLTIISNKEHFVSKKCGTKTLGEYLGLKSSYGDYYAQFNNRIINHDKDNNLLKEFIKLNLSCIYSLRNFDLHPFNIMVELDDNNNIKSFIPIDFGTYLQSTHKTKAGIDSFKDFINKLQNPKLVKECMEEVQIDLKSKKDEIIQCRDKFAKDLKISEKECNNIKQIWVKYTEKLAADCQKGQISLSQKY